MFEYKIKNMNKEVMKRYKMLQYTNLDKEPAKKKIIKKNKKKTMTITKRRNENHSQLNSHKGTHANYLLKYLSITNNLLG